MGVHRLKWKLRSAYGSVLGPLLGRYGCRLGVLTGLLAVGVGGISDPSLLWGPLSPYRTVMPSLDVRVCAYGILKPY